MNTPDTERWNDNSDLHVIRKRRKKTLKYSIILAVLCVTIIILALFATVRNSLFAHATDCCAGYFASRDVLSDVYDYTTDPLCIPECQIKTAGRSDGYCDPVVYH